VELSIPVKELMTSPKLMVDAQKASKSLLAYHPKDLYLLSNRGERMQGLSGIVISSSGEEDLLQMVFKGVSLRRVLVKVC
jgi:hypothetical protein